MTPICLSPLEEKRLSQDYQATGRSVWSVSNITDSLKQTSHNKCAYCETRLGIESHYLEVDHFEHKADYPEKVATWSNLIPSCRRCNGTKGAHDVICEPIINPYTIDPKEHFTLKNYRLRPKTDLGRMTIGVLDLNDSVRAVTARYEIGEQLYENLISCKDRLEDYLEKPITVRKNKLLTLFRRILLECQPSATYSATAATILHNEDSYKYLVEGLKLNMLWDEDLEAMHVASQDIMFSGV